MHERVLINPPAELQSIPKPGVSANRPFERARHSVLQFLPSSILGTRMMRYVD
jgi:hypothetical protein